MGEKKIYKCPRYEEKKRAAKELGDRAYYFDDKVIFNPPYTCPNCNGGLKCRITKDQTHTCAIVIDIDRVNWRNKKTLRILKTIAKAMRRKKAKREVIADERNS